MAGELRPHLGGVGLMAEQEAIDFRFLDDRTAAMVGDAGIVIADDPRPVEPARQFGQ